MHVPPFNVKNVIQNVKSSHEISHEAKSPSILTLWQLLSILNLDEQKCVRLNSIVRNQNVYSLYIIGGKIRPELSNASFYWELYKSDMDV